MPTSFLDAQVALGLADPGGLDPRTLTAPNPVTDVTYTYLPETFRAADTDDTSTALGWPLYGYIDSIASVLTEPLRIGDRIAAGDLTNPSLAPDEWIPWLAQCAGTGGVGVAEQRLRLARLLSSPPLGSRQYLRTLTQTFLTGTKECEVTAVEPWGIRVRVRAGDIIGGVSEEQLQVLLYATGMIPAGFVLVTTVEQETWTQLQTILPTWAPGEGMTWLTLQRIGLTGAGTAAGGISWQGQANGPMRAVRTVTASLTATGVKAP